MSLYTAKGMRAETNPKQPGYDVTNFIGIILKSTRNYPTALTRLESLDEVVAAYYTTGRYSILSK